MAAGVILADHMSSNHPAPTGRQMLGIRRHKNGPLGRQPIHSLLGGDESLDQKFDDR